MVTLLETEVNEQFQHSRDEAEQSLDEHSEKCNRKNLKINESINSLRNDVARLLDYYGSLRQIVTKHTDEMETLKLTFRKSCNSVKQTGAELKAQLEVRIVILSEALFNHLSALELDEG
ncbi:unnamed protein product [Cylicostephanus goldi]|uniref:Uncharacterized protein n=1 Tax=Cylicostephanus goldi TaxID=71465 RepID=A0A3P6RPN9_CYLGO|nr:unnamed protein product [Cylicostephanus goldi]